MNNGSRITIVVTGGAILNREGAKGSFPRKKEIEMAMKRRPDTVAYTIQLPTETVKKIKHVLADEGGTMMGFLENAVVRFVELNGLIPKLEDMQKTNGHILKANGHSDFLADA